jgi:peptide deformylase
VRIIVAPDPVLRQSCEPVAPAELKSLRGKARQMAKLMYKSNGCGIAAPQVGLLKRLMVVDVSTAEEGEEPPQDPVYFVNPEVVRSWGEPEQADEGCLSIPGIQIPIQRPTGIEVTALDLQGEPFSIEAEGFMARAIQHELDHLDGTTMFEHLDPIARARTFREYEQALRQGAKPGDTGVEDRA